MKKNTKYFIVLGLGKFGAAVVRRLHHNGCRVTGVDASEEAVEAVTDCLYEGVIADVTEPEALKQLQLAAADGVFIGLGQRYEQSVLAALHVKELGARRVLAKGVTPPHGRILKKLGVDQVIFPEEEAATYWADKETWPNIVDFLPIDPEYSLVEIAVPGSMSGQTLREANLRHKYGVSVIGVKDVMKDELTLIPHAEFCINDEQLLLVIGREEDLDRFRKLT